MSRLARLLPLAARGWPHALVVALLAVMALGLYLPLAHTELDYEDGEWLRGSFPGYRSRVVQVHLMHRVLMPLFSHRVEGHYLFAALMHLLCAVALYALLLGIARHLRTGLRGGRWPARAGAAAAAAVFLSHQAGCLTFLAGLSYQLFCLFGLLAVLLSLSYLGRGGTWRWLAGVGCSAVALLSHSYALGLPLFIGALELCRRRSMVAPVDRWNLLWRYALHLLPLWFFLVRYGHSLTSNRWSTGRLFGRPATPELWGVDLLHLVNYIEVSLVTLLQRSPLLARLFPISYPAHDLYWSPASLLVGAFLLLLLAGGLWTLAARRRTGPALLGVLFILLWSGLTFHQTLLVGYDEMQGWRYYHNAAGICIFGGALLIWVLDRLLRRAGPRLTVGVALTVILVAPAAFLLSEPGPRQTLGPLLSGELRLKSAYSWDPGARCQHRAPVSEAELDAVLEKGGSLACRDLSHMQLEQRDLRGLDLSGADLSGARLSKANLQGARLTGAGLSFATLGGANLRGADLRGANLTGASIGLADLTGADLSGAVMVGLFRYNIIMDGQTEAQVQARLDAQQWRGGRP